MPRQESFIPVGILVRSSLLLVLVLTIITISFVQSSSAKAKLLPDLVVKIAGPATAHAGDEIGSLITVVARNIGTAAAPGTTGTLNPANGYMIDLVLSTDANMPPGLATASPTFVEDALLAGARISHTIDLAPAASKAYPTGALIPSDTPTGTYHLCARIDSGSKVMELNERNNVACSKIKIVGAGKPDLVVKLAAPASSVSGFNVGPSLRLIARNIGTATAPGTTGVLDPGNGYMIDLVLSKDTNVPPGFATVSPTFVEDALLVGARTSVTVDLPSGISRSYATGALIPSDTPTGIYYLCGRIDPGNKVAESNEANNVTCVQIKIKHP